MLQLFNRTHQKLLAFLTFTCHKKSWGRNFCQIIPLIGWSSWLRLMLCVAFDTIRRYLACSGHHTQWKGRKKRKCLMDGLSFLLTCLTDTPTIPLRNLHSEPFSWLLCWLLLSKIIMRKNLQLWKAFFNALQCKALTWRIGILIENISPFSQGCWLFGRLPLVVKVQWTVGQVNS